MSLRRTRRSGGTRNLAGYAHVRRLPMKRYPVLILLVLLGAAACVNASDQSAAAKSEASADDADTQSVNGSIHVPAGKKSVAAATVNGSIRIDDDATVSSAHTVNGDIRVGAHASLESLTTVNGAIAIGAGTHVAESVSSVNGELKMANDAHVGGAVSTVNGEIVLTSAGVGGGISTVNGDISVQGSSRVEGGILVKRNNSHSWFNWEGSPPRIVIGPGASVQGELRFERKVKLYVSDRATIGPVVGTTPIPYTGDTPPA
jgi:DUF4097 and DUF4098 domain-containing protein YvlB